MNSRVRTDMNADWMQSYKRILCDRIFFRRNGILFSHNAANYEKEQFFLFSF